MDWVQQAWKGLGTVAVGAVLAVLALKVLWNFGSAYVMIRRALKQARDQPVSMSLHPLLDVLLLVAAILIAFATFQDGILRPAWIAAYGTAAVVASYLHLLVVGFVFGGLRAIFNRRR